METETSLLLNSIEAAESRGFKQRFSERRCVVCGQVKKNDDFHEDSLRVCNSCWQEMLSYAYDD